MKLNEIALREDSLGSLSENEVIALIRRECKPFLEHDTSRLMYRGMQSKPSHIYKQAVRSDRRPRNVDHKIHDALDAWFEEKFGFKARSETAFVTGSFADAKSYGKPYAVFPIGDFKFVWSPEIGDLFFISHSVKPEGVASAMDEIQYKTSDLEEAIDSGFEVMVKCDEYYAVPMEDWTHGRDFLKKLRGTE